MARGNRREIVSHILPEIGNNERDAVNDWIFAEAIRISAMKSAFQHVPVFFADNVCEAQRRKSRFLNPADRAERTQGLQVLPPHRVSPRSSLSDSPEAGFCPWGSVWA